MGTYPHDLVSTVVIDGFYIIVRNTVSPFLMAIPTVCIIDPVVYVYTTAFGTNPLITVLVLRHSAYNRAAQTCFLRVSLFIAGIDFIFRIEVIHSAEVSSQPDCSLPVFYDAPDRRMGKSVGAVSIGGVKVKLTCFSVISVQSVECSYP